MSNVVLVVITDGRRDYLSQTLASAQQHLQYSFIEKIIVNDAGTNDFDIYLHTNYPDFRIISHPTRAGLTAAINTAWSSLPEGTEYIFHLEEDFTFNQTIDIDAMVALLEAHPYLAELALKRQSVNAAEEAVGGFMQQNPSLYEQKDGWIEQVNFFTLNPCLYSIRLTKDGYPDHGDEGKFFRQLRFPNGVLDSDLRCAFWGKFDDPPLVTHIGSKRSGLWVL